MSNPTKMPSSINELYLAAKSARERAYAPYSKHQVGAALRTRDGKIFSGCNIENSSYGATLCAERVAIHSAVCAGHREITEIMVVTDSPVPWPPCGLCRQVISEFGSHALIHTANLQGTYETQRFEELLPKAFTPDYLKPGSQG